MPRTWIVLRQLLLTFGALLCALVPYGSLGFILGNVSGWLALLAVIPIAVGFYGLVGIWFIGEDSLDVEPPWIIPMTIVGICLLFFLPAAVPLTYLHLTGDRVTAVVTEEDSGVYGIPKIQKIRAVDPMTGADLGEIDYEPPEVEKPGDRFDLLVDPRGWVAPDSARLESPLPELGYGFGGTAFGLLALLTGLRIGRDLRRYGRTGSRLPPEVVADLRSKPEHGQRRADEEPDTPELEDLRELADQISGSGPHAGSGSHGGSGSHAGDHGDSGDSGGDQGG
ncbi:hypothetical protein AB0C12_43690 [Actinoplanes sp. NPDC048967]|uniref:hypothetical protein n=1 Tax=Actinoplanes sp. NPDC048967 TaxID=3155269 RepID=UPI00340048C6